MALLLYLITAAALLGIAHRYVTPIGRLAALALLLFPFCFMARALFTGGAYGPFDMAYQTEPMAAVRSVYGVEPPRNAMLNDVYTQMIPYREVLHRKLMHAEWPLWNPHTLCGEILAAAAQPAVFSPFTLIAALLPTAISFTYTASILFFLAALSLFLFARELGCRESAAAFGAAGWMYASAMAFFILWPHSGTWAVMPLVFLGTRRVVRDPGLRSMFLLTAALSLCILAGHPESVLHIVSLAIPYGIYELLRERRVRAMVFAAASGALTFALCAIYLLPFADATPQTAEYEYRKMVFAVSPHGVSLPEVAVRLATAIFANTENRIWKLTDVQQIPPDTAGVGSIVLAAAVYALWRSRHRDRWFFGAMLLFCLIAHSEWGPLARALQKLPLFDIALNGRYSFAAACLMAILGAIGVEELAARNDWRAFAATALGVLIVIAAGSHLIEWRFLQRIEDRWGEFRLAADIALLGVAALLIALKTPSRVAMPALVALVLLQRTMQESALYPTLRRDAAYAPVPLFDPLKNIREPFRVTGQGVIFIPGASAMYGLEDIRGYSAMTLRGIWKSYPLWSTSMSSSFNRVDDLTRPFLSFLNARFAVITIYWQRPKGWHDVKSYRKGCLIENENAMERAIVPRHVRLGYSEDESLEQMQKETDFRERAWVTADFPRHERINGPGTVTIRPRKYGFEMKAEMEGDGWVVISEPAWRGWRAYVDGRRIGHQTANIGFIGIFVPKGTHKLKLVFMPRSFVIGRAITLTTILALVVLGLVEFIPSEARDHWRHRLVLRLRSGGASDDPSLRSG